MFKPMTDQRGLSPVVEEDLDENPQLSGSKHSSPQRRAVRPLATKALPGGGSSSSTSQAEAELAAATTASSSSSSSSSSAAVAPTLDDNGKLVSATSSPSPAASAASTAASSGSPSPDTKSRRLPVGFWIVLSVLSSTFLILTNKFIMRTYHFTYIYSLTCAHFGAGAIALNIASRGFGMFTPKSIGLKENLIVAASAVGSVASMNLSLQYNSVGTYQMMKLVIVPTCMVFQYFVNGTTYTVPVLVSLAVMLFGVASATVTDVSFNSLGLATGVVAVLTTSLFAIWQGSKQKQHGVSAQQLLMSIAPYQTLLAGTCALMFDLQGEKSIFTHTFYAEELILIGVSCLIAVSVNICAMNLIGATSAVTYNVVGHAKTCLILLSGFIFMPGPPTSVMHMMKHLAGVLVGLLGVFSYSYFKIKAMPAKPAPPRIVTGGKKEAV